MNKLYNMEEMSATFPKSQAVFSHQHRGLKTHILNITQSKCGEIREKCGPE